MDRQSDGIRRKGVRELLATACLALAGALSGCATLPEEGPRPYTTALPPGGAATPLDRLAAASMAGAPSGESGFRLMIGPGGLEARLALLRNAQRSLDLQTYHLHDDATGRLVLRELRNAAQRGVRVRLLLDDLYTDDIELLLVGLAAYPNVEVRLFNPFPVRGGVVKRFGAALLDFARLNRRMHNKLFVADGVLAIAGGRNLGDEYFLRSLQANFVDYEVLTAGPVVPQLASLFDEYWNAPQVRTAASVLRPQAALEVLRQVFDTRVDGPDTPEPAPFDGLDRLDRPPPAQEIAAGRLVMSFGPAQAFADSPAKAWGEMEAGRLPSGALLDSSRRLLATEFGRAQREVWVASPYLVPGPEALASMTAAARRGVRIHLVTNSLAATDEPVVHTGYRRYRDNMLRAGVRLGERMQLHTKAAVVDEQGVFVGSVNFDPRSEALNTECGLLIRSPALADDALRMLRLLSTLGSYEVTLADTTRYDLVWRHRDPVDGEEVLDTEPGTTPWIRLKLYIQSWLIPESML